MVLKKVGGRNFIANLLADFIIEKLGEHNSSQIKVIDVENFFIIKGKTSSKEVLNLSDITAEFEKKYTELLNDYKICNTIDLIQYDSDLTDMKTLSFTFFNTENCSYSYKQIKSHIDSDSNFDIDSTNNKISDTEMVFVSELPHGFSLNQGRLLYYFMKKIFYSLPPSYPMVSLKMDINILEEDFIQVFDNFSQSNEEVIQSAILDCVDLNLEKMEKIIGKIDYEKELFTPLEEHSFLIEKNYEILII